MDALPDLVIIGLALVIAVHYFGLLKAFRSSWRTRRRGHGAVTQSSRRRGTWKEVPVVVRALAAIAVSAGLAAGIWLAAAADRFP